METETIVYCLECYTEIALDEPSTTAYCPNCDCLVFVEVEDED